MLLTNFQLAAYKFSEIRSTISFVTILVAKTSLDVRNDLARDSDNLVGGEMLIYACSGLEKLFDFRTCCLQKG